MPKAELNLILFFPHNSIVLTLPKRFTSPKRGQSSDFLESFFIEARGNDLARARLE